MSLVDLGQHGLPVWAGVAIRYQDGSVVTFEMDHPIGTITTERKHDDIRSWFTQDRVLINGELELDIHLAGPAHRGDHWSSWRGPAPAGEIEDRPALPSGKEHDDRGHGLASGSAHALPGS